MNGKETALLNHRGNREPRKETQGHVCNLSTSQIQRSSPVTLGRREHPVITPWVVFASEVPGSLILEQQGVDFQDRQNADQGMKGRNPKERQHEVMGEGRTGDGRTFWHGGCHAKWNKPDAERKILHGLIYTWNLEKKKKIKAWLLESGW